MNTRSSENRQQQSRMTVNVARKSPRKNLVCLLVLLSVSLLSTVNAGAAVAASATSTKSCGADPSNDIILERILASEYESLDPVVLTNSIKALKERGAHRCWHKHSTFLEHLLGVHNILRLWGQGRQIGRVGLFHSAYSNSYVNLALFDPAQERQTMKELIRDDAEE